MNAAESSARTALNLYRRLMRYGQQLELTDKSYYNRRVRKEFRRNRDETDPAAVQFQLKKGEALLNNRRVL